MAPTDGPLEPGSAGEFNDRLEQVTDEVEGTGAGARPSLLGSCGGSLIILDEQDAVPSTEDEWTEWDAKMEQGSDSAHRA